MPLEEKVFLLQFAAYPLKQHATKHRSVFSTSKIPNDVSQTA
jgi:hypothetical protein